jgi:hypothetical protein
VPELLTDSQVPQPVLKFATLACLGHDRHTSKHFEPEDDRLPTFSILDVNVVVLIELARVDTPEEALR